MNKEEQLLQFVLDRYNSAKNSDQFNNFKKDYKDLDDIYKGNLQDDIKKAWRSKLKMMSGYSHIETVRGKIKEALFRNDPFAIVVPRKYSDIEKSQKLQKLWEYIEYKIGFRKMYQSILGSCLKSGNGITRTYWRYETKLRTSRQYDNTPLGNQEIITENEYVCYDEPYFRWVNPLRFYPDPTATSDDDWRYVIEEYVVDFDELELKAKDKKYKNLDTLWEMVKNGGYNTDDSTISKDLDGFKVDNSSSRKKVKIIDYWGSVDIEGYDSRQIYNILIAQDNVIILTEKNPYWHNKIPYQLHQISPQENSIYGIGLLKVIKGHCLLQDALVNQRLDNVSLILNGRYLVDENKILDFDELTNNIPGGFIRVANSGELDRAVKQLQMQDITGNTFQQVYQMIQDDMQKATGATDYSMGINRGTLNQTATGVTQLTLSANQRFDNMIFSIVQGGFKELINTMLKDAQQFMDEDRQVAITEDGSPIIVTPQDIEDFEFDIEIQDTTTTNKEMLAQMYINLKQVFAGDVNSGLVNPTAFNRMILENVPQIKNVDEILSVQKQPLPPDMMKIAMQGMGGAVAERPAGNEGIPEGAVGNEASLKTLPPSGAPSLQGAYERQG